jgi:DNA-binding NtrC family response regulator
VSRVSIDDDQRDVLEALRILLKGEGHQTEAVTSISGIFNALQQRDYALLMMDLNYTRDTTSGQEGLEVIPKIQALESTLPSMVYDRTDSEDIDPVCEEHAVKALMYGLVRRARLSPAISRSRFEEMNERR